MPRNLTLQQKGPFQPSHSGSLLTALGLLLLVVLLGLPPVVVSQNLKRFQLDQAKRRLEQIAAAVSGLSFPINNGIARQLQGLGGVQLAVFDAQDNLLAASTDLPIEKLRLLRETARAEKLPAQVSMENAHYLIHMTTTGSQARKQIVLLIAPVRVFPSFWLWLVWVPCGLGIATVVLAALWQSKHRHKQQVLLLNGAMQELLAMLGSSDSPAQAEVETSHVGTVQELATRLQQSLEKLRQLSRFYSAGLITAAMVHQFRNLVAGTKLAMQLHGQDCPGDRESLNVALRQLETLEKHATNFLTLLRDRPEQIPGDFKQQWNDLIDLLQIVCREKGVQLTINDSTQGSLVVSDPLRLQAAVLELALNAIDATNKTGHVRVALRKSEGMLEISVSDSGSGPDATARQRLFSPFFTTKAGGMGLGLYATKQTIESLGGHISWNRSNGYTTFILRIPLLE